jgi:hypothetical protein
MDYFKIITILFMIIIIYQIYLMNCRFNSIEGFEGSAQSLGGVDDTNAINTLAQIAKNLMAGGVTVPGNMALQGDIHTIGTLSTIGPDKKNKVCLHTPPDGRRALYIAPQKLDGSDWEWGNGLALEFHAKTINTQSNNLIVQGRNIIAELDKLNSRWDGDTLIAPGGIHLANKWGLYDTGDDWIRINNIKDRGTNAYRGGIASRNLWSDGEQFLSKYPKFGQNTSFKPNPDSGRCFDFGSHGRTGCDNGWSVGQLIPR